MPPLAARQALKPMFASLGMTALAGWPQGTVTAQAAVTPGRRLRDGLLTEGLLTEGLLTEGLLPWVAFHVLCLWMRSAPDAMARLLGADGFDASFGLGDGN